MSGRPLPVLFTVGLFAAAFAACAMQFPAMLSTSVLTDLISDNAVLGLAAVGMTVVIVSGGIDLSVGGVVALSSLLIAVAITRWHAPPQAAFAAVLAGGALFGAAMGGAIWWLQMPPFIVTLAGMFLARGACFVLTADPVAIHDAAYDRWLGLGVPLPGGGQLGVLALLMLVTAALGGLLLHATPWGLRVFAIGGERRSAELMGLSVRRTSISVYAFSGFCAALAGIGLSLYTKAGNPLAASGIELDAIAAVVIGGAPLAGGAGAMAGTLFGVLLQGLILVYITFDGTLSSWWARIAIGALLFAFITLQKLVARWAPGFARGKGI